MKKGFGWFFVILGGLNIIRGFMMLAEGMGGGILFFGIGFIVLGVWMINTSKANEDKSTTNSISNQNRVNDIMNRPNKESVQPKSLYEQVLPSAMAIVINGYRRIAAERNIAPTSKTSDEKIIEIYRFVGGVFNDAAKQKGEHIPAKYLNTIVLKFYQVYELGGDIMLKEHLKYEVEKYAREGLRQDYKEDLNIFRLNS